MSERLKYLESLDYAEEDPFFADDIKKFLEDIFHPRDVADISDMDNGNSFEYLVALDNKGYLSENMEIAPGIFMETMDKAIERRDLHYLYVQLSTVKPFLVREIWKYLKKSSDLEVYQEPLTDEQAQVFDELSKLIKKYGLVFVNKEDLDMETREEGEKVSFYEKYF